MLRRVQYICSYSSPEISEVSLFTSKTTTTTTTITGRVYLRLQAHTVEQCAKRANQHDRHLSDDDLVENLEHALFRCCKPPSQYDRTVWLNGMRDALTKALSSAQRKDPRGRRPNLEWASLPKSVRLSLAVGSPPPAHWILLSDGTNSNRKALSDLHGELVAHTARYIADIDMGLRKYCRRWLQSVDEDDTIEWKALHELWEDLPDFDSDDSDGRSDDESDDDDT